MTEKSILNNAIHVSEALSTGFDSRTWRLLAFYGGVPVIVALYGGLNNWQLLQIAGYGPALAFYAAHAILPWWTTCALTSLAMLTLARWKPSPYVLMLIGSLAAAFVTLPYTNWLTESWDARWPSEQLHRQIAPLFSAEFWRYTASATAMWFVVNFIFDRFLGLPRYRYEIPRGYDFHDPKSSATEASPPTAQTASTDKPGFMQRMPVDLGLDDILAIKAEQHYIRVYTAKRDYMLLHRFSDAVRELGPDIGVQVHRSYWINKNAVDCIKPRAKKFLVKLVTGAEIPVSTPYHAMVRDIARSRGLRERP
ncbi:MAG: LytTR family transcriptional regulator [Gammaproteobacteria bacterium]|nr:LytTR family transcriptional regulator [Gammaproteobacteria bacterium]